MSEPQSFQPLGNYNWPSTPVNRGLATVFNHIRKRLGRTEKVAGIDPNALLRLPADRLATLVEPPAHFPLIAELDEALSGWLADSPAGTSVRTLVLPPCDREDLLSQWAEMQELQIFGMDQTLEDLDALDDSDDLRPLVIPKLERRFLRTRGGLHDIRRLLDRLAVMERRIIIGCNSWAWQFLRKSCEIDLIFSEPLTFQAFDKTRLRSWLGTLALDPTDEDRLCFRAATTGQDVFGNGDGEAEVSAYMTDLAKRSLGIPWVAWHLWRSSLHVAAPDAVDEGELDQLEPPEANCEQTIWVTDLKSPPLPSRSDQNALLLLHALLIHGGLTQDEIAQTVPLVTYTHVVASLMRSEMIDCADGLYRCLPSAYPAIRDALKNNGYPVDVL